VPRNTYRPSSRGTSFVHTPITSAVHPRIQAKDWQDGRLDVTWTLTKTTDSWTFAQLPKLVLPEDQDTVIDE